MQTDWIGKSYGAEVDFPVDGRDEKITVYTTRPDTFTEPPSWCWRRSTPGKSLATDETREAVEKYIFDASMKSNVIVFRIRKRQAYLPAAMPSIR